eukprot:425205_1
MALPKYTESVEKYELQFAVNHLGHFYLSILLTPLLLTSTPNRVIILSSSAHSQAPSLTKPNDNFIVNGIKRKDGPLKANYSMMGWKNYGLSKTCNVLFAREFNRRYNKKGITAVSLHPGFIKTELGRYQNSIGSFVMSIGSIFAKSIPQGAATTIRCVSLSDDEICGGHYYKDCNEANDALRTDVKPFRGQKKKVTAPKKTKPTTETKKDEKKEEKPKSDEADETDKKEKDDTKSDNKEKADNDDKPDDAKPDDADKEKVDDKVDDKADAKPDDAADGDKADDV